MTPESDQATAGPPPSGSDERRSIPPPGRRTRNSSPPPGTAPAAEIGGPAPTYENRLRLILWELIAITIVATVFFALEGDEIPVVAGLGVLSIVVVARHVLDAWLELTVRAAGGGGWHERPLPLDQHPRVQLAAFVFLFIALWALVISNLFNWLWFE